MFGPLAGVVSRPVLREESFSQSIRRQWDVRWILFETAIMAIWYRHRGYEDTRSTQFRRRYARVLGFLVPRSCPIWSACPTSPTSCAGGRRLCECHYRGSRPSQVCDPCVFDSLTWNIGRSNLMCISCVDSLIDKLLLLYVHHHHVVSLFHIFTCHLYVVHCWPSYSITDCTNCLSIIFYKPMVIYTEGRIEGRL